MGWHRTILAMALCLLAACPQPEDHADDRTPDARLGTAELRLDRTAADLGATVVGKMAVPGAAFLIANVGTAMSGPVHVTASGDFVAASTCGTVGLAPGARCTASVTFTPSAPGPREGILVIEASPGGHLTGALTGTGVVAGEVAVAPSALDFPQTAVDQTSTGQVVTVSNGYLPPQALMLFVRDPMDFTVASNCPALLAGGSSCTATVRFTPMSEGAKDSVLVIATGNGMLTVALTGVTQAPARLTIDPPTASFVGILNQPGSPVTFTVRNAGEMTTGALTLSLMGTSSHEFTVVGNDCGALAAQAACHVDIVFTPTELGPRPASLVVSATPGGTIMAALTGVTSDGATLELTPPSPIDLGVVEVGKRSAARTVVVKNFLAAATPALQVVVFSDEFATVTDTCTGAALAPQASCTIDVAVTPKSAGALSAILVVAAGPAGQSVVTLNATAR